MKCDVMKMRAARDRRALTQDKLAVEARVDVRTVQRAEAGSPLRQETIADLAAVLGLPVNDLIAKGPEGKVDGAPVQLGDIFGPGMVLKRATSGRQVIELLEQSALAKLECEADPTEGNLELLKSSIQLMEGMLPNPWDCDRAGPLNFTSQVDRVEKIAAVNKALVELERAGLALFYGSAWESAMMPSTGEFRGMEVYRGQPSSFVQAARLVLSNYMSERITVQRATRWGVEIVTKEDDDIDDDVPF